MDRVVRLYQLWSWLPHFRAVAETEHLPTASAALGVGPSALSRALKQLESAVGCDLFERDGRNIRLNENGRELLGAVRLAMRGIDDALVRLGEEQAPLSLRISSPGPFHAAFHLNVVDRLKAKHSHLSFDLLSARRDEVVPWLCRGVIDVVVDEGLISHPELSSRPLAELERVVCCSPQHELARATHVDLSDLVPYRFAAPPRTDTGARADGWPVSIARDVGLTVSHMQMGIDACESGRYLTLLPRPVAVSKGLTVLAVPGLELSGITICATTRRVLSTQAALFTEFLDALTQAFAVKS